VSREYKKVVHFLNHFPHTIAIELVQEF